MRNCHTINTWQQFNLQVDYIVNSCVAVSHGHPFSSPFPFPLSQSFVDTPLNRSAALPRLQLRHAISINANAYNFMCMQFFAH